MNREEFCSKFWKYYLMLEKDFLDTERYVSFDLGDNYLCSAQNITDFGNSTVFSLEYIKEYQAICSEVEAVLKEICTMFNEPNAGNMKEYSSVILNHWQNIIHQEVKMRSLKLKPFEIWSTNTKLPWWGAYNEVKHERLIGYKQANLKNVTNALAGLYILELYLVKEIGDKAKADSKSKDESMDVPNDVSKLFSMIGFKTRECVIGYEQYVATEEDVCEIIGAN